MKKHLLIALIFYTVALSAQNVAINASGAAPVASAMLDITSTTSGLLIPRMTSVQRTAIVAPATGLYVYDTTTSSFWFFNGTIWVEVTSSATGWLLAGNTLAGTEKLGSVNAQPVRLFSNNVERARIIATGEFVVNSIAPFAGDMFSSYSTGTNFGMAAYASGTGYGIYSQNSGGGSAMRALGSSATAFGVFATNSNVSGTGIIAAGNNAGAGYSGGGSGGAFTGATIGLYAVSNNVAANVGSSGVIGRDAGGPFTMINGGAGLSGTAANSGVGVFAYNTGIGSAVYSQNGNATAATVRGINTNASGTGGVFSGNNLSGTYLLAGSGISGMGTTIGVFGYGNNAANNVWGGYFSTGNNDFAYVGGRTAAGVVQKINGTGVVSTIVKNTTGSLVNLYCPESPEILFQDFGAGVLVNGQAHVTLDPDFSKNILVDQNHPLRVIIQLEGDCKGVFVTNKNGNGFDIKELQGGSSNVPFTWFVSANRADEPENNAVYSNARFSAAPLPLQKNQAEIKEISTSQEVKVAESNEPKKLK